MYGTTIVVWRREKYRALSAGHCVWLSRSHMSSFSAQLSQEQHCTCDKAAHLWGMACLPSAESGRNSSQTPNSLRTAQCSGFGSHWLYSPTSDIACVTQPSPLSGCSRRRVCPHYRPQPAAPHDARVWTDFCCPSCVPRNFVKLPVS